MFKSKIQVSIEISPGEIIWRGFELDEDLFQTTFISIDNPATGADPLVSGLFCTNKQTIERTLKSRNELAGMISKKLTESLLDAMGAKDTRMGYSR